MSVLRSLAVSVLMVCAGLPACAIDDLTRQTRLHARRQSDSLEVASNQFEQRVTRAEQVPLSEIKINKPWVSGKPMPLARELSLPRALRADIKTTLIFRQKPTSLIEVAQRIAQATQIPVRVRPEALLPVGSFLPRLTSAPTAAVGAGALVSAMPTGTRPLSQVLDHVAASHQVQWQYTGKSIEFYRTETRVFDVKALTLSASTSMRLGKSGVQGDQGFDSASQTELSVSTQSVMGDVAKQLEPFLTRAGVVAAQPGSLTSVVITDTPESLDAVSTYLERLNRRLTRRVRLVFEQMTVTRSQHHEQGIDWQLSMAADLAGMDLPVGTTGAAPTVFSMAASGPVGLATSLVLKAVSRYADVVRHTTVPVTTLNRRPVTHAVRSTFTYVDQVKSVAMSSSDKKSESILPGIAVSQKRETVGAFLTLVPDVQDDGQVLLSVAFDNTVAMPLKTLTFGGAQSQLQIQQLDLRGSGTVQQVAMYPGRPTLIAGFEHRVNEVNQNRKSPHAPKVFGGDDLVDREKTVTLIFVTAQVQDGV